MENTIKIKEVCPTSTQELIQRGYKVSCDKLYLTYARYDDLSNLSYYPIDKFYNYMNQNPLCPSLLHIFEPTL